MIIGLDVGGTHTDVVLLDKNGLLKEIKVTTDPLDLFNSVLTGLIKITEGVEPEKIHRIVLSTTLTTNAIVQKKFPKVGMIVSSGPGLDPELHRTNRHYFAVSGSIDHRGREIEPVDPAEIKKIGKRLKKENIQCVGVVSKFSVRNPEHEFKIHEILDDSFDKVFLGHRISGNLNFPRRIATTYLNAAVYPIHKAFYEAVQKSLEAKGLSLPIRILKADGGNMNFHPSIFPDKPYSPDLPQALWDQLHSAQKMKIHLLWISAGQQRTCPSLLIVFLFWLQWVSSLVIIKHLYVLSTPFQ